MTQYKAYGREIEEEERSADDCRLRQEHIDRAHPSSPRSCLVVSWGRRGDEAQEEEEAGQGQEARRPRSTCRAFPTCQRE